MRRNPFGWIPLIAVVRSRVVPGMYFIVYDLKDAYFTVLVETEGKQFLRFIVNGHVDPIVLVDESLVWVNANVACGFTFSAKKFDPVPKQVTVLLGIEIDSVLMVCRIATEKAVELVTLAAFSQWYEGFTTSIVGWKGCRWLPQEV